MEKTKDNLIKNTCKELKLTYRELGEKIGYSEATLNKNASTGEVSTAIQKAIELYCETLELRKELNNFKQLKEVLKEIIKE